MTATRSGSTSSGTSAIAGVIAVAVIALACGSHPIPLTAQAGTTFVLMIPKHIDPGFGRGWSGDHPPYLYDPDDGPPLRGWGGNSSNSPDLSLEDLQRGELFIYAHNAGDPNSPYKLPLAYMTRVAPSRTSAASLARTRAQQDPTYSIAALEDENNWEGQTIAFIDIPVGVPGGVYDLYTQRAYRQILPVDSWDIEAWQQAWFVGGAVQLKILAAEDPQGPGDYSDFIGFSHNASEVNENRLKTMVPYPELRIDLATVVGATLFRPAAAEIELTYPSGKLGIAGVSLGKNDPSAAVVRWEVEPGTDPPGCWSSSTLRIHMIDPDMLTGKLRVAFHHIDPANCPERVGLANFNLAAWSLYDENGVLETGPMYAPTLDPEIY